LFKTKHFINIHKLQPGLDWVGTLIFLNLILYITALNLIIKKLKQKSMQCASTKACTSNVRGVWGIKKGG